MILTKIVFVGQIKNGLDRENPLFSIFIRQHELKIHVSIFPGWRKICLISLYLWKTHIPHSFWGINFFDQNGLDREKTPYWGLCIFPVLGTVYFLCAGALLFSCTGALFSLYWGLCSFFVLGPYFFCTGALFCLWWGFWISLYWGLCIYLNLELFSLYWVLYFPYTEALFSVFVFLCTGTLFSLYWGLHVWYRFMKEVKKFWKFSKVPKGLGGVYCTSTNLQIWGIYVKVRK